MAALLWPAAPALSLARGSAIAALPLSHGAGGPFDEFISLGIIIALMTIAAAVFIWSGRKKGK